MEKPFKSHKCNLSIEVAAGGESKSSVQHSFAFWTLLKVKSTDITVRAPWIAAATALGCLMDSEDADQDGLAWLHSLTLCQGQVFYPSRGQCHTNSFFFFSWLCWVFIAERAFSRCSEWGDALIAVHRILTAEFCCQAQALRTPGF